MGLDITDLMFESMIRKLPNLEELNIAYCEQLTANSLHTIGKKCKKLKTIRVRDIQWYLKNLRFFKLSESNFNADELEKFKKDLKKCEIINKENEAKHTYNEEEEDEDDDDEDEDDEDDENDDDDDNGTENDDEDDE